MEYFLQIFQKLHQILLNRRRVLQQNFIKFPKNFIKIAYKFLEVSYKLYFRWKFHKLYENFSHLSHKILRDFPKIS